METSVLIILKKLAFLKTTKWSQLKHDKKMKFKSKILQILDLVSSNFYNSILQSKALAPEIISQSS